jgi:hypothetical protein
MNLESRIAALEKESDTGCTQCFEEFCRILRARGEGRDNVRETCDRCHRSVRMPLEVLREIQRRRERGEPMPEKIVW